uniref:Uncharacterized protein n=1 Tax=Anopheles atroparvus TaxID=41427 RepID=A0A182JKW2_ANOAO
MKPAARPSSSLFKRRNNGSPLTRTTTPAPEATQVSTGPSASSKFYGKSKYRPGTLANSVQLATATTVPSVTRGLPDGDQDIEPSIRQNNKLYNAKNRYQQIGEAREDPASLEQELLDAITTISRAPLPITSTPTARPGYEDLKEGQQVAAVEQPQPQPQQPPVAVEQQYPAGPNQRATTHRYNITHEYPYPLGYTAPAVSTSTRRSQKLVQRPRIATQSQYYYQQANPGSVYYTSPIATATISPRQDTTAGSQPARKRKPAVFEKTHSSTHEGAGGRASGGDGFTGRTYRPSPLDYDYYDDGDARVIGKSNSQVKVIMHGPGIIECLDQGNFPHPLSCKKFISCAKMEIGGVIGWEYTCPKGLSYDPVGGICNWSAGLGCKD